MRKWTDMKTDKFYYTEKADHTLCIERCFGENGLVEIPEQIDGKWVTELAPYCFAPDKGREGTAAEQMEPLFELGGREVEEVILPPSVRQIGKSAFYNCRNLRKLTISRNLKEIGGDAFMNCLKLGQLVYEGEPSSSGPLRQILIQVSWNVEVIFRGSRKEEQPQAVIFYPEYVQGYDEIGPAHIFGMNIKGEGFRMRQCFQDGRFLFSEYDAIFPKACAEEPLENLGKIAAMRLAYPYELSENSRRLYVNFIKEKQSGLFCFLTENLPYSVLEALMREGCLCAEIVSRMIEKAAQKGEAELSVCLNVWKKQYIQEDTQKRYDLEF